MARLIRINVGRVEASAELNDTRTARAIWEALPIKGQANIWGKEIYFPVPVRLELDAGQELVEIGDLGYWPEGSAFCIFFGPTPISRKGRIRPASAVTVFGKVVSEVDAFILVGEGEEIIVERGKNG